LRAEKEEHKSSEWSYGFTCTGPVIFVYYDKITHNPPLLTKEEEKTLTDKKVIDETIVKKFYDWCLDYSHFVYDNTDK